MSEVWIDAEDGEILLDNVRDEERELFVGVLETVRTEPLDRAKAPWPYDPLVPTDAAREQAYGISFIRPVPSTGLQVIGGTGIPNGPFLGIANDRSSMSFLVSSLKTQPLSIDDSLVKPDDQEAIERWASEVKICGADIRC